jgi:PPOX class probable F420-dependent enzyme
MKNIPEKYHDLLKDEVKAFLFLATVMKDGSPQVTPIWFNHDDEHILINSAKGRVKDRNMRARPQVAFVIQDPADPYRYLQIRGQVVEITEEGGLEHIKSLAAKYTGKPWRGADPDEIRVIYKILPNKIDAH